MNPLMSAGSGGSRRRRMPLLPGRIYHIYSRGNNRENLFREERNYHYFLALYAKHLASLVDTLAYCLLRNHFHLAIRVKQVEVGAQWATRSDRLNPATRAFTSMFQAYAMAINKAYNRTGKLFEEHFERIEVTSETYLKNLIFYIHFNPQKHNLIEDFREWPWSSYAAFLSHQPTKLQREEVLARFDGQEHFLEFHRGVVDEGQIIALIGDDFE